MSIEVKSKLCAAGTLKSDVPHQFPLIFIIELIASTNGEESTFLLMGMLHPQETHCVNTPLDSCLHPSTQLPHTTTLLFLLSRHLEYELRHHLPPVLSHSHRPHSRTLVQSDQSGIHDSTAYGYWGPLMYQPLRELCNNESELTFSP